MPLTKFTCTDNQEIVIEDCLKQCRLNQRCIAKPLLGYFAEHRREAKLDTFSTTQLINPSRSEYLKLIHNYAENPKDMGYRLMGLNIHRKLEKVKLPEYLQEEFLKDDIGTGFMDSFDADTGTLYDFKVIGYYKVKKILDNEEGCMADYEHQLSRYAQLIEKCGFIVKEMYIQAIVRDYGFMSKKKGVTEGMYLFPVRRLTDDYLNFYFSSKKEALLTAIKTKISPVVCEDTWDGKRCTGYCSVKKWCDYGKDK